MIVAKGGVTCGFFLSTAGMAMLDDADAILAVLIMGATLKGCTEIQHAALPAAVNDVIKDEHELAGAFAGITAASAMVTLIGSVSFAVILFQNLTDYTNVFLFAAVLSLLSLLFVLACFPETMLEEDRRDVEWEDALPLMGTYPFLFGVPYRGYFCVCAFCASNLIVGYLVVVPPFLQSQYGLSQGVVALLLVSFSLLFSLFSTIYTSFIPLIDGKHPDYQLYAIGYKVAAFGIVMLNFSLLHYSFFVVSLLLCGFSGGLVFPSYRTIAAALEPPAYQGKLHAALGSVSLVGAVTGSLGFGAVVKWSGLGSDKCGGDKASFTGWPFLLLTLNTVVGAASAHILMRIRLSIDQMPSVALPTSALPEGNKATTTLSPPVTKVAPHDHQTALGEKAIAFGAPKESKLRQALIRRRSSMQAAAAFHSTVF
jgi:MFS family permease